MLQNLTILPATLESLMSKKNEFKSDRLRQLLTPDIDEGLYPSELLNALKEFEKMIIWKKSGSGAGDEIPEP